MASQALRRGTLADAFAITECTNKAFLADAFFKKPEYHLRFTEDEVGVSTVSPWQPSHR
jgi:hypothetical protein